MTRGRAGGPAPSGVTVIPAGQVAIAATMSEAELDLHVRGILRDVAAIGQLLGYHTHDSRASHPGFPDWTFAGPGGLKLRELKTAKGRLTGAQEDWQRVLKAGGADAGVWRPEDLLSGRIAAELAQLAGLRGAA